MISFAPLRLTLYEIQLGSTTKKIQARIKVFIQKHK